ncbi:hypothetical protein [Achromobacter xylosoxidans]|uniref:hypothetical protein n=1 Tax=Alcaligenes xylosoxydans xylosoxydans TaxID=85698 RepID=UPI0012902A13|nr:hypothetical protein [Achromobacter xylosoxidans]
MDVRKCEIHIYGKIQAGNFYRFGDSIYFDDGNNPMPKTVAIVELADGKVVEVEPNQIRFID